MFSAVGGRQLVHLIDPARIDFRPGFFVRGLPRQRPYDAMQTFADWLAQDAAPADFSRTGLVFHVSRCGSTLLAQNLKASGALVLSEPPFMRLLRTRLDDTIDAATAAAAVARVVGQWQDWAQGQGKRLVIKLNSQMHEWCDAILAALPGAAALFLHRDPAPVFESIERGPPQYLRRDLAQQRHRADPALAATHDDPLLLAAAARYCGAIETMAGRQDKVHMLAYPDLAASFAQVCTVLGLTQGGAPEWNAAIDAKAQRPDTAAPYRPVGSERLALFRENHAGMLALVEPRYRNFLQAIGAGVRT
ncbi:MAG: hypothetical protein KDE15_12635 [Erythrobacter sp.]|nr:hypothetical protein [Erythrobacter sp.]